MNTMILPEATNTTVMGQIAKQNGGGGSGLHGVTGLLAIVLMLFHAVWATVGWSKKTRTDSRAFINSVFLSGSSGSFRMFWVCSIKKRNTERPARLRGVLLARGEILIWHRLHFAWHSLRTPR